MELEELSDGQWFPKSFSSVWPLDASGTVIAFSNAKVNPDIADEAWVFDFPDGTRVEDYVSGYYYIMGEAFDQDKRVNEFMVRHNLKGDAPSRESKSTVSSFRVAMLLVAVAPLLLVVLWVIKRRKVG